MNEISHFDPEQYTNLQTQIDTGVGAKTNAAAEFNKKRTEPSRVSKFFKDFFTRKPKTETPSPLDQVVASEQGQEKVRTDQPECISVLEKRINRQQELTKMVKEGENVAKYWEAISPDYLIRIKNEDNYDIAMAMIETREKAMAIFEDPNTVKDHKMRENNSLKASVELKKAKKEGEFVIESTAESLERWQSLEAKVQTAQIELKEALKRISKSPSGERSLAKANARLAALKNQGDLVYNGQKEAFAALREVGLGARDITGLTDGKTLAESLGEYASALDAKRLGEGIRLTDKEVVLSSDNLKAEYEKIRAVCKLKNYDVDGYEDKLKTRLGLEVKIQKDETTGTETEVWTADETSVIALQLLATEQARALAESFKADIDNPDHAVAGAALQKAEWLVQARSFAKVAAAQAKVIAVDTRKDQVNAILAKKAQLTADQKAAQGKLNQAKIDFDNRYKNPIRGLMRWGREQLANWEDSYKNRHQDQMTKLREDQAKAREAKRAFLESLKA